MGKRIGYTSHITDNSSISVEKGIYTDKASGRRKFGVCFLLEFPKHPILSENIARTAISAEDARKLAFDILNLTKDEKTRN